MKICLTGHSGFIGKHIFDFFKDKHSVVKINLRNIQTKKDFKKIMNSKNISRKECLLLPFKTLSKALKL